MENGSVSEHLLELELEVYGDIKFSEWLSMKATEFYERYRSDTTISDEEYNKFKNELENDMNVLVNELKKKGFDEDKVTLSEAHKIIDG